jgi:hypothetical protein
MLEVLSYISSNAITSGNFLSQEYLSVLFEDEELLAAGIYICSLEKVFSRYHVAVNSNDFAFLTLLRRVHREARGFLREDATKQRISQLIVQRSREMENQAVWNAILALVAVVQNFPRNFHARIMAEVMPRLTANTIQDNDAYDVLGTRVGPTRDDSNE